MGERSCLLYQIEQALRTKGVSVELRSVDELRALFRGRSEPFTIKGLRSFLSELVKASTEDVAMWQATPPRHPAKARRQSWETICTMERSDILEAYALGVPAFHIAKRANVGTTRILQIIKEGKK